MLGIWFVLSKQYSDKLSEDVRSGNSRKMNLGETLGARKHGYRRGENGKWEPDGRNFEILQWAFEEKIRNGTSDYRLSRLMNERGYGSKIHRNGRIIKMSVQKLNPIWTDPFYYGLWKYGEESVDLREVDTGFIPMIDYFQHLQLLENLKSFEDRDRSVNLEDDLETIRAIPHGFLIDTNGRNFSLNLPNKTSRHLKKLQKVREEKPDATLGDVVKPYQIYLKSLALKTELTFDQIEAVIGNKVKQITLGEGQYEAFLKYFEQWQKGRKDEQMKQRKKIRLEINRLRSARKNLIEVNLDRVWEAGEKEVYRSKLAEYDSRITFEESELKELGGQKKQKHDRILSFARFLKNLDKTYHKASYVRKREICEILFSNMVFYSKKRLVVKPKPLLTSLFIQNGGRNRKYFERIIEVGKMIHLIK